MQRGSVNHPVYACNHGISAVVAPLVLYFLSQVVWVLGLSMGRKHNSSPPHRRVSGYLRFRWKSQPCLSKYTFPLCEAPLKPWRSKDGTHLWKKLSRLTNKHEFSQYKVLLWSLMGSTRAVQSIAIFCRIWLWREAKIPGSCSCLHLPNTPWPWLWHIPQFLIILQVSSLIIWGLKSSYNIVWGFLRSWFVQMPVAKLPVRYQEIGDALLP